MKEYNIERAWFLLDGAPYPVQGYHNLIQAQERLVPGFARDEAEHIVELINRGYPLPMLEWSGDNPLHNDIVPTEEGAGEGFETIYPNLTIPDLALWWMPHMNWSLAEPPNENMWHLEFKSREEPSILAYGSGITLIQALAAVERDLMLQTSVDAAFHKHCCFLSRDITSIEDELGAVGGYFSCYDFSAPEDAFEIRRIPINPEPEAGDETWAALERLEASVHKLADTMGFPIKS